MRLSLSPQGPPETTGSSYILSDIFAESTATPTPRTVSPTCSKRVRYHSTSLLIRSVRHSVWAWGIDWRMAAGWPLACVRIDTTTRCTCWLRRRWTAPLEHSHSVYRCAARKYTAQTPSRGIRNIIFIIVDVFVFVWFPPAFVVCVVGSLCLECCVSGVRCAGVF